MEEICNFMANKKYQKGTVIIITFVILITLLFLGAYFLAFSLTESKISRSQGYSARAYYLAEAGINEVIWKLKNNDTWKTNFETDPDWSPPDFSRNFGGGSYTITVKNLQRGRAEIMVISTLSVSGGTAQRIVRTEVYRATGSLTRKNAFFTGGSSENIAITNSKMKVDKGNIFCNNNLHIEDGSLVEVYDDPATEDDPETLDIIENLEGQVLVVKYLKIISSNLNDCEVKCDEDECLICTGCTVCPDQTSWCGDASNYPILEQEVPMADIISDDPNSFESRAQIIYSASDFEDLLEGVGDGGTLTLSNEITCITGNVNFEGDRYLVVNGILVVDGAIYVGVKGDDFFQLTINRPSTTSPSGLLATGNIKFGEHSFSTDIQGVIYTPGKIDIKEVADSFNVEGGVIGRKLTVDGVNNCLATTCLNITLNDDIIEYGLGYSIDGEWVGQPEFSPTIIIDYWEESY